ncbi:MAG: YiiX/YebB-like N1pC/P60 family cysteine hydrolase [Sedimentisphaeraceae bacterium JB056]
MKFTVKIALLCLAISLTGCSQRFTSYCGQRGDFDFQNGDLLFFDYDCGPMCDAIEEVTTGYDDVNLSHVGLIEVEGDTVYIIEAVSQGVVRRELGDISKRASLDEKGRPKVMVGRLAEEYQPLIPDAIAEAKKLIGKKYDKMFLPMNDEYYCSELVYQAFKNAAGYEVFKLEPMTFKSPQTGEFMDVWIDHYEKLRLNIPEGIPGINPAGMTRNEKLIMIEPFGKCSRKSI